MYVSRIHGVPVATSWRELESRAGANLQTSVFKISRTPDVKLVNLSS